MLPSELLRRVRAITPSDPLQPQCAPQRKGPDQTMLALLSRPGGALKGDQAQAQRAGRHRQPRMHSASHAPRPARVSHQGHARRHTRIQRAGAAPGALALATLPNAGRAARGPVHRPLVRRPIVAALAAPVLKLQRHLRSAGAGSAASAGRPRTRSCCAPPPVAVRGCGSRALSLALPARCAPLRQSGASASQPLRRNRCCSVPVRWCAPVRQSMHVQRQLKRS
jgi:hypothetical protein